MTWAPQELAIEAATRSLTYSQVAAVHGLTRHQVSGIVYRIRHGLVRTGRVGHGKGGENRFGMPILMLLSDGRIRTAAEIAERVGCGKSAVFRNLWRFEREGLVRRAASHRGNLPIAWQEVEQ